MSGYALPDLQRAVLARLKASAAVAAEVGARVYDTAPANAAYPLIAVNQINTLPNDTDTTSGSETDFALSVFARGTRARVDVNRIGGALIAALDRNAASLTVPGHKVVLCSFTSSLVFRDDVEKGGAHGVFRFRIVTEDVTPATGF
jgi:hypothetical protein